MRTYPTNSPQAAARVVALATLADGHLSRSELGALDRLGAGEHRVGRRALGRAHITDRDDAGEGVAVEEGQHRQDRLFTVMSAGPVRELPRLGHSLRLADDPLRLAFVLAEAHRVVEALRVVGLVVVQLVQQRERVVLDLVTAGLIDLLQTALKSVAPELAATPILLERPKQASHGDFATNLDLLPTVLRAAGAPGDEALDGRPLQSAERAPDDVFVQISESQIGRAIRTTTHTFAAKAPTRNPLAGHQRPGADHYVATHLYDNTRDPHQRVNLIADRGLGQLRDQLAARLADRIEDVEGIRPTIEPPS